MSTLVRLSKVGAMKFFKKLMTELVALVPIIALMLFLLNASVSKNSFETAKENILQNTESLSSRKLLINLFLLNNQFSLAKQEAESTLKYTSTSGDYLAFVDLLEKTKKIAAEEGSVSNELSSWQLISNNYPSYRDAFIKLAILSLKTNRQFETKKHIESALALDPNSEISNTIKNEANKN